MKQYARWYEIHICNDRNLKYLLQMRENLCCTEWVECTVIKKSIKNTVNTMNIEILNLSLGPQFYKETLVACAYTIVRLIDATTSSLALLYIL